MTPTDNTKIVDFLNAKMTAALACFDVVVHHVEQAVLAERERCAVIAEQAVYGYHPTTSLVAAKILRGESDSRKTGK